MSVTRSTDGKPHAPPVARPSAFALPLRRDRSAFAGTDTVEIARAFPRQALHAWRLSLRHPTGGKTMSIVAPLPADMRELLAALGFQGLSRRSGDAKAEDIIARVTT